MRFFRWRWNLEARLGLAWGLMAIWTALVAASLMWNLHQARRTAREMAKAEAHLSYNKDLSYRLWAANHGGVYVPVTPQMPPNPYLSDIKERDIQTPSGRTLTLVNPAYMTRQVQELAARLYGARGHLTSLKPLRPENAPDPWEAKALEAFGAGANEVIEVVDLAGEPHMRFMRPWRTEMACLKCHAAQGYKEGDIRGGISVSVPLKPYFKGVKAQTFPLAASHGLIWMLGLAAIFLRERNIRRRLDERRRAEAVLGESEARYRSMFQNQHAVMLVIDPETGALVDANPAACSYYGFSREEVLARNITDINVLLPEEVFQEMQRAKVRERQYFEFRHRLANGEVRDVEVFSSPIQVKGQQLLYSIVHDVTARKQAEEALQQAHNELEKRVEDRTAQLVAAYGQLDAFFTHSITPMVFLDKDVNFIRVNEAYARACQRRVEDFPGHNHFEFYPHAENQGIFAEVVRNKTPYRAIAKPFEFPDHPEWGVTYWDWTLMPILDEAGQIDFLVFSLNDVTERRRAEEATAKHAALVRDLYNNAPCGYHSLDREGRFVQVNDTELAWLGYSREEMLGGMKFTDIITAEGLGTFRNNFVAFMERGWLQDVEYDLVRKDGSILPVSLSATAIKDEAGNYLMSRSTVFDITDRKRAQKEIKELNEALEQRVKERTAELEFANRELEAFSYSVSHDLKAPIRAIQGFSRMLAQEQAARLDEEGLRLFKVIVSNTEVMARLIDDLLALSRLGRHRVKKAGLDLAPMIRENFERLRAEEPGREFQLTVPDLPPAWGEPSLINQVMMNLLGNAIKYTRGKKIATIEVGGYIEGQETIYYVKDNGVGFDERYTHKLFGVFQRLHGGTEYEGTGVGLAIVQRIIQRHGGRVWAEGKVGEGSTFYFALPRKGE